MNSQESNTIRQMVGASLRLDVQKGIPITMPAIAQKVNDIAPFILGDKGLSPKDLEHLVYLVGQQFNVKVAEEYISIRNVENRLWLDGRRSEVSWTRWEAYYNMLLHEGRSEDVIKENQKVIDDVLDFSGDPTLKGEWARKGLVMGNVQSGKTQNYIGLINKAIDCGYKTVILLGGHLNDLRKQTQERVDHGVLGEESRHLQQVSNEQAMPVGIGEHLSSEESIVNSGTTTVRDFNKAFAEQLSINLKGEDPTVFTIKKHAGVMTRLCDWITNKHYLDIESGIKLEGPLLLIDDEADYASINTKHHKDQITSTNNAIRSLLGLFKRNTYVGYTATPFANIFIDPSDDEYTDQDDLFPKDFIIKMPIPDSYLGQDFYFPNNAYEEDPPSPPVVNLDEEYDADYRDVYQLKSDTSINQLPLSLKKAIRAFLLAIGIRECRGDKLSHNTMLVNISHLTVHQIRLESLISSYHSEVLDSLKSYASLGVKEAEKSPLLRELRETFEELFFVPEKYSDVFARLKSVAESLKVWATNGETAHQLDYSRHEHYGLNVIVIGGHKLSRGLTLQGLSISYFARNSKAYDTLTQMCRWFGYRPRYEDLCRVFLPKDSIDWYTHISSVIQELYAELDLMSRQGKRPSEFGLKVREHPGALMITARNKIGAGESIIHTQDYWGQTFRRFRFASEPEKNEQNLHLTKKFVTELRRNLKGELFPYDRDKVNVPVFTEVDYSSVIDFIRALDYPEGDLASSPMLKQLRLMEEDVLPKFKVGVFNQQSFGKPKWLGDLDEASREFLGKPYELTDEIVIRLPKRKMESNGAVYSVSSVNLADKKAERLFHNLSERNDAEAISGKATNDVSSQDYINYPKRDFPTLMIYLFGVAVKRGAAEHDLKLGHGFTPTIGYTITIPRLDNLANKTDQEREELKRKSGVDTHLVNKVGINLQYLIPYEELEDGE